MKTRQMLHERALTGGNVYDLYRKLYSMENYRGLLDYEDTYKLVTLLKNGYHWGNVIHYQLGKRTISEFNKYDKALLTAISRILNSYYDALFRDSSHGFRPNRGPATALSTIRGWSNLYWYVHLDIINCYGSIKNEILMDRLRLNINDHKFIRLIESHLDETGEIATGSPLSPLLCNIYLDTLDDRMYGYPYYLRYVDNIILAGRREENMYPEDVLNRVSKICLHDLKLKLKNGGDMFLGCVVELNKKEGKLVISRPLEYTTEKDAYYTGLGVV